MRFIATHGVADFPDGNYLTQIQMKLFKKMAHHWAGGEAWFCGSTTAGRDAKRDGKSPKRRAVVNLLHLRSRSRLWRTLTD